MLLVLLGRWLAGAQPRRLGLGDDAASERDTPPTQEQTAKMRALIEEMHAEFGYFYSKRADMKLTPQLTSGCG